MSPSTLITLSVLEIVALVAILMLLNNLLKPVTNIGAEADAILEGGVTVASQLDQLTHVVHTRDAGCTCAAAWSEQNPDAFVATVAEHLQQQHNVKIISNTLANFVKAAIRQP